MNIRHLCVAAFGLGLVAVVWVVWGYALSNPLALAITLLIMAFYLMGALELRRYHQATAALAQALSAIPQGLAQLGDWLGTLPATLQNPVRLRVEGERVGLPGPALTPYLVGLLVLLGMLGTFLGMVVTLNGAVQTLQSSADLSTMRAALTAPVKGLGLAFGTSVAGVAASAVLGLMSALCRRERQQVAQTLDTRIATTLRKFSLAHQREETLKTLQAQAQAMPAVVDHLQAVVQQMALHSQQLSERLLANQNHFHQGTQAVYSELAKAVDLSLKTSLAESARVAAATLQPVAATMMDGIARQTTALHEQVAGTVQAQLAGLVHSVDQRSAALLATVGQTQLSLQAELAARDEQRLAAWRESMAGMAATLQQAWQQAGVQAQSQQAQICQTLDSTARDISAQAEAHARSTITEIGQLMQAASAAPRVAAEVIGELRQQLSNSIANDNAMLQERSRLMATLSTLLEAVQHASSEQRGAIDALLTSTAAVLEQVGSRFSERVAHESGRLGEVAAQITGSAVDVASLGEAFGHAVQLFSASNEQLMDQLQRIEGALGQSLTRSDEQLAYYVAQAREVVDLSMLSQQQIVQELQRLASRQAVLAGEVA